MRQQIPIQPENSTFTNSQWQAIYETGHDILVSASAGSGKTTVLVTRVIEKIKAGNNIEELLIVTYTEAAAKEMKERIERELKKAIEKETSSEKRSHYLKQLEQLPTAAISTLHAFCLQVVRRYYYIIEMDPVFRLLTDETEMILLKEDVWEDLREELYGEQYNTFYHLTENFSNDRNDDGLMKMLFSLYNFARSKPDPKEWLEQLPKAYDIKETLAQMDLYQQIFKPNLIDDLIEIELNQEKMVQLVENEAELAKIQETIQIDQTFYEQLKVYLEQDQLDEMYVLLQTYNFPRFSGAKRGADEAIKEVAAEVKNLRDINKEIIQSWQKSIFSLAPSDLLSTTKEAQKLVSELARICLLFHQRYTEKKTEKNLIDFNDLEHQTLKILTTLSTDGHSISDASTYYRQRFVEVLVDEYQDINQLQETILFWVSRQEVPKNLFMVGDVKQSIYSFRLADPTLFIQKYNDFAVFQEKKGNRIILAENFRSRKDVLDFTNLVFSQLMDSEVGQIDYDQAAHLVNGFQSFPKNDHVQTELLIFETGKDEEVSSVSEDVLFEIEDKTQGELRIVGYKIKELIQSEFLIYDKKSGKSRPIQYKDIVLLTPTKKNNLLLLDIFKEMEIPLHVKDTENYFQATEIRIMIALLTLIDNPYQDIPLATVLRSPIVGLRENELAEIRLSNQQDSFYQALLSFLQNSEQNHSELAKKVSKFLKDYEQWRDLSRKKSLSTLIWQIYLDTGFLDYVGGMIAGKQRQANLHALYERAAKYEEMSFKGLFQFVRFVEKMQEKNKDLAEPTTLSGEEDAVRVMTIHASKGLEFPVVFILDLTRRFNMTDLRQRYVFDEHFGVGMQYLQPEERLLLPTLPFLAIRQEKKKKLLAEEMRKLYVALTRAEEKLFLVGSYKNQAVALKEWSTVAEVEKINLPKQARLSAQHLMKWVGMSLIRYPDAQSVNEDYAVKVHQHPARFKIEFFQAHHLQTINEETISIDSDVKVECVQSEMNDIQKYVQQALNILDFQYPYQVATHTTSYQSVSEIKRVFEDPDDNLLMTLDLTQRDRPQVVNRFVEERLAQPEFMQQIEKKVQATDIGSATHLILQLMPLYQPVTKDSLEKFVQQLVNEELIQIEVAKKIKLNDILYFFENHFGKELVKNQDTIIREQPFSMLLKAKKIFTDYPNVMDQILIHGMVDGYFEEDDGLVLFDYKTDFLPVNASQEQIEKIVKKYRGQLYLYRLALEQATGLPVKKTALILLSARKVIFI